MIFLNQSSKLNVTGINEIFWLILYFSLSHKSLNSYTPYTVLLSPVLRPALALALVAFCSRVRVASKLCVRPSAGGGKKRGARNSSSPPPPPPPPSRPAPPPFSSSRALGGADQRGREAAFPASIQAVCPRRPPKKKVQRRTADCSDG